MVEVKVQEFSLVLSFWLVNLPHKLSCQHHFALCFCGKQINELDGTVSIQDVIQVYVEGDFCHFRRARHFDHFIQAWLLPKDWHWAANLNMRKQEFAVANEDLLGLHLITHVSKVIDAAGVVPSASSEMTTARHKRQHYGDSPN